MRQKYNTALQLETLALHCGDLLAVLTGRSLSGHGIYFPDLKQLHFSSEETYLFPLQATGPLCNLLRQRSITRVILFALTILLFLLEDMKKAW